MLNCDLLIADSQLSQKILQSNFQSVVLVWVNTYLSLEAELFVVRLLKMYDYPTHIPIRVHSLRYSPG